MQNFKIVKRISDGAFGTVYEARYLHSDKSSKYPPIVAIKQIYSSSQNLKRQLQLLKKLPKHRNIVEVYDSFNENFMTSIVMERGRYDLTHWIGENYYPVPERIVKNIAFQVLEGLRAVHAVDVIHRDLKPSNLVVRENGAIALCDFGSAVVCSKGEEYELEGFTRWYKCPEMLYGSRKYKFEVDIWSVGCILMEIAAGEPLFNGKSEIEQIALMAHFLGDPSPAHWPSVVHMPDFNKINFNPIKPKTVEEISKEWSVSEQLVKFILKMIRYENRPSAQELLKDEYFKDFDPSGKFEMAGGELRVRQRELLQGARKTHKI